MSGPPQRKTAERMSALVNVTVQLARGFAGAATARSAGSGTGARYGWPALHTHELPERTTLFIQHPSERVYPPFELAKYARIDAPWYVMTRPAVALTAVFDEGTSTRVPP